MTAGALAMRCKQQIGAALACETVLPERELTADELDTIQMHLGRMFERLAEAEAAKYVEAQKGVGTTFEKLLGGGL